jgi:subtilisin family serine protease
LPIIKRNILVVAAAGNNGCECLHIPAAAASVLSVGAMDANGDPSPISNWGAAYQQRGILAPGEHIPGAVAGGGTAYHSGTSFAASIIAGVVGVGQFEGARDRPRQAKSRALRLIHEFSRSVGEANVGGAVGPLVTAYRQDALRCAQALAVYGPMRVGALSAMAEVPTASLILRRNVYGWFARIERGIYALTPEGDQALSRFAEAIPVAPSP